MGAGWERLGEVGGGWGRLSKSVDFEGVGGQGKIL